MTESLQKAFLLRLKRLRGKGPNGEPLVAVDDRGVFEVQFNPTSLKITQQNNIDEGGATTQTQRRQNPSAQSATLSFDLEFDTAEEVGSDGPVDVRRRTAIIRQFASPSSDAPKEPPPLLKFLWGTFSFVGIVNQLTEELDFFSAAGRPLRAKVAVTMKEVRLDLEAKLVGAAARTAQNATPPDRPNPAGGAPGTPPTTNPDSVALAQLGESVQQLLARLNADPATWRAAMAGLESPLSLAAGAQVQLAAGASAGLGLGVAAGFAAGGSVGGTASLAGALGVTADAGFVLAEGGGLAASARTVAAARARAAVGAARSAFEVPEVREPAPLTGPGRPPPPRVDPRTQSFGRGIPLSPRVTLSTSRPARGGGNGAATPG